MPDRPQLPDPIRLLFCCDPGYFEHLAAALASVLQNNHANILDIHLAVSRRDPLAEARLLDWVTAYPNVSFRIHGFDWGARRWATSFHISQDTYVRLFAAHLLEAPIDKVLYLDADLLVLDDLRPLWETDVSGHAIAAVPDPFGASRPEALGLPAETRYVNAGVLLMNLKRWREADLAGQLSAYIERMDGALLFHDQDAINRVLRGQIRLLDYRWNFQAKMLRPPRGQALPDAEAILRAARAPAVLHYTSARKPWLFVMPIPRKRLYYHYLKQTPWRNARPADRRLSRIPEFLLNHALYLAGVDYTWDRVRRATLIGRAMDRLLRRLRVETPSPAAAAPQSGER